MKIVFTDYKTMNPGDINWEDYFDMQDVILYEHSSMEELLERIQDAEIVVTNKTKISSELIEDCARLKCICVSATGYNNVDVLYAAEKGIPVLNAANYSDSSVAQHAVAMVLNVLNKVEYHNRTVHEGRWSANRDFTYYDEPIEELNSMTIGFIGYGSLGRATSKIFKAFGAKIAVLEYPHRDLHLEDEDIDLLAEADFFKVCDIVSLHVPLTERTKHMVDREFLAKMKPSSILLNTSRGPVIEEEHLAEALKSTKIRAACLDVLSTEPPQSTNPLLGIANCIITPHQAWASKQARMRLMQIVAENISAFKQGIEKNRVN